MTGYLRQQLVTKDNQWQTFKLLRLSPIINKNIVTEIIYQMLILHNRYEGVNYRIGG